MSASFFSPAAAPPRNLPAFCNSPFDHTVSHRDGERIIADRTGRKRLILDSQPGGIFLARLAMGPTPSKGQSISPPHPHSDPFNARRRMNALMPLA